ncbi:TrmH family RNA methyltransferase [Patescibacteria group bacterium]|nr:TrmH family RNA methyltransferase [Patescibacteria group bacterium]
MLNKSKNSQKIVVLDNIRSVFNVGSIFRTCDAVGIDKIYLCGLTPCPIDRFGRARADFAKVSLGAEKIIDWEYTENTDILLQKLKKEGFTIIAVEQTKNSVDYKKIVAPNKAVFVFGNEVEGVLEDTLGFCDVITDISMKGKKESLNVAVSAGIVLFRLLDN